MHKALFVKVSLLAFVLGGSTAKAQDIEFSANGAEYDDGVQAVSHGSFDRMRTQLTKTSNEIVVRLFEGAKSSHAPLGASTALADQQVSSNVLPENTSAPRTRNFKLTHTSYTKRHTHRSARPLVVGKGTPNESRMLNESQLPNKSPSGPTLIALGVMCASLIRRRLS